MFVLPVVIGLVGLSYILLARRRLGAADRCAVVGSRRAVLGRGPRHAHPARGGRRERRVPGQRHVPRPGPTAAEQGEPRPRRAAPQPRTAGDDEPAGAELGVPAAHGRVARRGCIIVRHEFRRKLAVAQGALDGRAVGRLPRAALPARTGARSAAAARAAVHRRVRPALVALATAASRSPPGGRREPPRHRLQLRVGGGRTPREARVRLARSWPARSPN